MKKFFLASVGLLALSAAPALAADMAPRAYRAPRPMVAPIYNWGGFYVGINGGGGSSHNCWDLERYSSAPATITAFNPYAAEGCHNATGGTVGGQIGYRWQAAQWVFGLEAQGNWADFRGSNPSLVIPNTTNETRIRSFGLFTGQIGYAWNNVLLYAKGGAAVTDDRYRTYNTSTSFIFDNASETRWGSTVGAGLEVGFAPNWSVAFEYNHLFMGGRDITSYTPAGAFSATDRIRQDADIGTVRVNYTFGGPVVGRY